MTSTRPTLISWVCWNTGREIGHWRSVAGRFTIRPVYRRLRRGGWMRPLAGFEVRDHVHKAEAEVVCRTVRECKQWAEDRLAGRPCGVVA